MSPPDSSRPAPVIAIDGPAGAGKSTLARALARALGLPYVNTGLMYRAVASRALAREVDPDDEATLADIAARTRFELGQGDIPEVLIDGADPDASLATHEVESIVSAAARHPAVRRVLRERQRALGEGGGVMEGRDIGTVVFPDADVKIFLSADPGVRAVRRVRERRARKVDRVARAVAERDVLDRRTNPLEPAPDAHVLDSTRLKQEEVLAEALRIVREALAGRPA
jgi:cytidylate kinase